MINKSIQFKNAADILIGLGSSIPSYQSNILFDKNLDAPVLQDIVEKLDRLDKIVSQITSNEEKTDLNEMLSSVKKSYTALGSQIEQGYGALDYKNVLSYGFARRIASKFINFFLTGQFVSSGALFAIESARFEALSIKLTPHSKRSDNMVVSNPERVVSC
jgi:hypothetical protein